MIAFAAYAVFNFQYGSPRRYSLAHERSCGSALEINPEEEGPSRLLFHDLDETRDASIGIVGEEVAFRRGLVQSVFSEQQMDLIIDEADKQGVRIDEKEIERAKNSRLEELKHDENLRTFHINHNIVLGNELIIVDWDALGLNLDEEGGKQHKPDSKITIRQVAYAVIDTINREIQKKPENLPLKSMRKIILNDENLGQFHQIGFVDYLTDYTPFEERILNALIDKGYIFGYQNRGGYGYHIHA